MLSTGQTIEDYPHDQPYPSRLMLGWIGARPLHVVVADNRQADEAIVITAYELDPDQWTEDFCGRRTR